MWQGEKLIKMAKELGIDYENSSSEQEVLKSIANKVGIEDYNNLYDKDKLEEKLNHYLKNRNEWNNYNQQHNINNRKGSQFALPSKRNHNNLGLPNKKTSQGLANNQANRRNVLSSFLNKRKKKNNDNVEQSNGENSSDTDNNLENEEESKEKVSLKKRAKQIKLAIMILGPVIFFLFIILVLIAIVGYIGSLFGVVSLGSNTTMTDNKNEQKYYEKLDSVVAKYQKSCGITIDKNYIHTILVYPMSNYDEFFGQDFSLEDIGSSGEDVDYKSITGQIDTVAKLLVKNCSIDYDVDGTSYNRVLESSFFKKHYKETLKKADAQTILEDVFNLAEVGSSLNDNAWFINDNLKVVLSTCNTGQYLNGSEENSTIGFSEYIMGVVYGELENYKEINATNKEFLKAQVIAATSYALARSGYQPGDTEISVQNGDCWQVSCNINNGCTYAYDLGQYGTCYTGIVKKDNTDWTRGPIPSDTLNLLKGVFNDVFGTIMVNTDGSIKEPQYRDNSCGTDCMGQKPGMVDAQNGMTYKQILDKYYDNFTLSNAKEGLYADNVSYSDGGYNAEVIYYNQNDYSNVTFCGRTSNTSRPGTIKTSGCGTTAMSIVLSTLVDKSLDPVAVMEEAYGMKACGVNISGTSTTFFKKSAKAHDLGYKRVSKRGDLQAVLNALESGKSLVIAHMGPSTFTKSGHYIVLARVNENGKVYVYDPNKPSRNGWYDFNSVIVKELRGSFHIITKG